MSLDMGVSVCEGEDLYENNSIVFCCFQICMSFSCLPWAVRHAYTVLVIVS